jgi:hypothetical protein
VYSMRVFVNWRRRWSVLRRWVFISSYEHSCIHVFLGKNSKNIKKMMNNVTGTIVPIFVLAETFVCLEFRYVFVGDLLPIFSSEN